MTTLTDDGTTYTKPFARTLLYSSSVVAAAGAATEPDRVIRLHFPLYRRGTGRWGRSAPSLRKRMITFYASYGKEVILLENKSTKNELDASKLCGFQVRLNTVTWGNNDQLHPSHDIQSCPLFSRPYYVPTGSFANNNFTRLLPIILPNMSSSYYYYPSV